MRTQSPQHILLITANRLGDAVLTTGVVQELLNQYPTAEFTLVCGPVAAPLWQMFTRLKIITMHKQKRSGHWWQLWQQLIGIRFDWVIDFRNSLAGRLLRKRRYTSPVKRGEQEHTVEYLARTVGFKKPPTPSLTGVHFPNYTLLTNQPILALGPTANWRGKIWPVENFIELANELTKPDGICAGWQIVLLGAPGEEELVNPITTALPTAFNLVGQLSIPETTVLLQQTSLYIGNDSGLMHLAAALGIPTLGLFGPSRLAHYRPWGTHAAYVQTDLSYDELISAPNYNHRTTGTLMASLRVENVLHAVNKLLSSSRASAGIQTSNRSPALWAEDDNQA